MHHLLIGFIAFVLATVSLFALSKYDYRLGEILGMHIIFPLAVLSIVAVLEFIYAILHRIFSKESSSIIEKDDTVQEYTNEFNDLYLLTNNITNELIEYRIENCKKEIVMYAKCQLRHQRIDIVDLYSEINKRNVLTVTTKADISEYSILEEGMSIGNLKATNQGIYFNNLDNKTIYSATLETVGNDENEADLDLVMNLIAIELLSSPQKPNYSLIKGQNNEILGKYFFNLHNLDMNADKDCKLDRNIAIIFAVFSEFYSNRGQGSYYR